MAAADVWLGNVNQMFGTDGGYLHLACQPEKALLDATFQDQVGAGIGSQNTRHRAAFAQIWFPWWRLGVLGDETTFLMIPPPIVISIVIAAFRACRCNHSS